MRISVYELPFATSIHVNRIRSVKEMIFQGIYSKQGLSSQEGVVKSLDLFSNQIQDDFPASWAVTQLVILRGGFFAGEGHLGEWVSRAHFHDSTADAEEGLFLSLVVHITITMSTGMVVG